MRTIIIVLSLALATSAMAGADSSDNTDTDADCIKAVQHDPVANAAEIGKLRRQLVVVRAKIKANDTAVALAATANQLETAEARLAVLEADEREILADLADHEERIVALEIWSTDTDEDISALKRADKSLRDADATLGIEVESNEFRLRALEAQGSDLGPMFEVTVTGLAHPVTGEAVVVASLGGGIGWSDWNGALIKRATVGAHASTVGADAYAGFGLLYGNQLQLGLDLRATAGRAKVNGVAWTAVGGQILPTVAVETGGYTVELFAGPQVSKARVDARTVDAPEGQVFVQGDSLELSWAGGARLCF